MTNLKRIESQARGRIVVSNRHWLDEMKTLRDNHSNELEKIIDSSLKRSNPFKGLKFKGVDIPRDGWETDRQGVHFQFSAESSDDGIILQGGCFINLMTDFDEFNPDSKESKKALKSKVDMGCSVQLYDEDGRPDSTEKDLRIANHNLTYDEIF